MILMTVQAMTLMIMTGRMTTIKQHDGYGHGYDEPDCDADYQDDACDSYYGQEDVNQDVDDADEGDGNDHNDHEDGYDDEDGDDDDECSGEDRSGSSRRRLR